MANGRRTEVDLEGMSLAQLVRHSEAVNKAIEQAKATEQEEVKQKLIETASKSGFSLSDLGFREKRVVRTTKDKYKNPKNPAQTWSGRGRAPAWFNEAGMKKEARSAA